MTTTGSFRAFMDGSLDRPWGLVCSFHGFCFRCGSLVEDAALDLLADLCHCDRAATGSSRAFMEGSLDLPCGLVWSFQAFWSDCGFLVEDADIDLLAVRR